MKQSNSNNAENKIYDKIARRVAEIILQRQHDLANKVYLKTARWQKTEKVVFLLLTCFMYGGLTIVVMIDFLRVPERSNSFVPTPISPVKSIYKKSNAFPITDKEFRAIQDYKHSHPQLSVDKPGLYDSLQRIEQIYQSQKK